MSGCPYNAYISVPVCLSVFRPPLIGRRSSHHPAMSELIFEGDEVNLIAVCLDGKSLASFSCTSRSISENLKSPETLRWLADLRGLSSLGISSVEHLELAEIMASVTSNIYFNWGSMDVDRRVHPSLKRLALAMSRHPSLCISIEAHCGLEARFAMPLPEQARDFTARVPTRYVAP